MNRSPGEEKINHFQFHETEHVGLAKTVSELPWYLTSTETTRLIRDREKGVWRWVEMEIIIYISIATLSSPE